MMPPNPGSIGASDPIQKVLQRNTAVFKFGNGDQTLKNMNLKNFQNQISPIILQRGKAYFDDGAVGMPEEEDGLWSAEVEGSEVYLVEVELAGHHEIESYYCDCPHGADICKHIVAVFYALKTWVKTLKPEPAKKDQALSFGELLKRVSDSELKEFVELFARQDNNFKNQFELRFAHKGQQLDPEEKYTDLVKKIIRSSMHSGFLDYYSAGDLSGKVDAILANAQEAMHTNNFKDASIIVQVVLKQLIAEVVPYADDSNGDIGDTISNAVSMLNSIAGSELCARELKETIHDFLAGELIRDGYFGYGDYGEDLFEIFRNLSVFLKRGEAFLVFTSKLSETSAEKGASKYLVEYFTIQTILFLKETGNIPEAEKLMRQNIDIAAVRRELVNEAMGREDYTEAKGLINQGIVLAEKNGHPGTVLEWQKILLYIAGLEGDLVKQRHFTLLFAFKHGFDPGIL
jgi:hypothetical protein